jgi:hypothetical protein
LSFQLLAFGVVAASFCTLGIALAALSNHKLSLFHIQHLLMKGSYSTVQIALGAPFAVAAAEVKVRGKTVT